MNVSEVFVLLAAGTVSGLLSTVVSIASLVSYPVLLALGVPPLTANMTNTVSLVLTGAGSVASSRPELAGQRDRVLRLAAITGLGGVTGAAVLLLAPASTFTAVAPVLIGGASVVLFTQPRITALAARPETADATPGPRGLAHEMALFAVAVYVGYFGAAGGVLLLVVLSSMVAESLVKVNAIKNAVNGAANFLAAMCFAAFGSVRWLFVVPLAAGFLIGGWFGPKIARRVPAGALRAVVSVCGVGLAVKLGVSAYR
jgi:uncharacterized membrane protein YfcA